MGDTGRKKGFLRRYKWFLLLGGIYLGLWVVGSPKVLTAFRQKPIVEGRFHEYASALIGNNYEEAYQVCGTEFRAATSFETFQRQQEILRQRYGELEAVRKGAVIVSIKDSPSDWSTLITADLEFENQVVEFSYFFRHENGVWVLFGYKQKDS